MSEPTQIPKTGPDTEWQEFGEGGTGSRCFHTMIRPGSSLRPGADQYFEHDPGYSAGFHHHIWSPNLPIYTMIQSMEVVPYDSPILCAVQDGDIFAMQSLFGAFQASIHATDPYGLGLFYVSCRDLVVIRHSNYCHYSMQHITAGEIAASK